MLRWTEIFTNRFLHDRLILSFGYRYENVEIYFANLFSCLDSQFVKRKIVQISTTRLSNVQVSFTIYDSPTRLPRNTGSFTAIPIFIPLAINHGHSHTIDTSFMLSTPASQHCFS